MRHLFVLLLITLFCCSHTNQKIEVPSDFYFRINNGSTDNYNSKTGLLRRCGLDKSFGINLTDSEKKEIYNLYRSIDFQNIPREFEIDWNDSAVVTLIMPSFITSIEICEKDSCRKVNLNLIDLDNPIKDKPKALEYMKLYDRIWQIIRGKEEYKNIPESDCIFI